MCGIAALFAHGKNAPPPDQRELERIAAAMAARGPDDAGAWASSDGRTAFAHRRLAIIDLSPGGHQPMALADGSCVITFNGEIYNYQALRQELIQKGCAFRTQSDTEVLLQLYAREGRDFVRRLRGMYAFALWDARKRGVLLARDPFGIKPLYYSDDGKTLRAASQVKALRAGGHAGHGVSAAGHAGFFLWGHVPDPHTLYADIHAVPAGTTLWADEFGVEPPNRFFDLADALDQPPAPMASEALQSALEDSVRHHFIADTPVGIFLSAGIDSGSVVSLAARGRNADLRTVTLAFDQFERTAQDEAPLAERVARAFGTRHETRRFAKHDFAQARAALFDAMDQPTTDGVNTYFVARAAKEAGLKVALSGLGGDEIFGGYPSFHEVPAMAAVLAPFRHAPALGRAVRMVTAPLARALTSPKYAGLLEYGGSLGGAYLLRRALFMPWELAEVLDPDMAREGWRQLAPLVEADALTSRLRTSRQKVAALEMAFYMRDRLLRDADWAGMAHSVEIRVPFVDPVLLAALAPSLASEAPPTKRDLASALPTALPDEIVNRPKTGFVAPVREWLSGDAGQERGLRGWARLVHRAFAP